jgi:hypothetical protein
MGSEVIGKYTARVELGVQHMIENKENNMKNMLIAVVGVILCTSAFVTDAHAEESAIVELGGIKIPVTAEELREQPGLSIFSVDLPIPEDEEFSIAVLTVSPEGKETFRFVGLPFKKLPGKQPSARLSLFPRDTRWGHALSSDDASEMCFKVDMEGCSERGFSTPSAEIPGTGRLVPPVFRRRGDILLLCKVSGKDMIAIVIVPVQAEIEQPSQEQEQKTDVTPVG